MGWTAAAWAQEAAAAGVGAGVGAMASRGARLPGRPSPRAARAGGAAAARLVLPLLPGAAAGRSADRRREAVGRARG